MKQKREEETDTKKENKNQLEIANQLLAYFLTIFNGQLTNTHVLVVRIVRQRLVADSREHFCMGNSRQGNRVLANNWLVQGFRYRLDSHLRTTPKPCFSVISCEWKYNFLLCEHFRCTLIWFRTHNRHIPPLDSYWWWPLSKIVAFFDIWPVRHHRESRLRSFRWIRLEPSCKSISMSWTADKIRTCYMIYDTSSPKSKCKILQNATHLIQFQENAWFLLREPEFAVRFARRAII